MREGGMKNSGPYWRRSKMGAGNRRGELQEGVDEGRQAGGPGGGSRASGLGWHPNGRRESE